MSANWTTGVDVSRWQGAMDWERCANAGAHFAFIRASSGGVYPGTLPYEDYEFQRNSSLAPEHLLTSYYHFFNPQVHPALQAHFFCDRVQDKIRHLPPVVDVEMPGNEDYLEEFIDVVEARLAVKPIEYTRATIWTPYYADITPGFIGDLWIARYSETAVHPWLGGAAWLDPQSWDNWHFWQWSADGNDLGAMYGASSDDIDLNRFNGGLDDLLIYAGLAPPPTSLEERVTILERQVDALFDKYKVLIDELENHTHR